METNFETIERERGAVARERIMSDLQALARDAEGLLKVTASDMSERAKDARARVSAALERAKSTCAHLQEETVSMTKAAAKKTDAVVREHPYESIGVAFGIGLLFGVVVARR